MITHRCKGSLNNRLSIRYQRPYKYVREFDPVGWQLYQNYFDTYYGVWAQRLPAQYIKYCPYCGEKLKERETK